MSYDPDRLLQLKSGAASSLSYFDPSLEFPISPERVAPLLRNLPDKARAWEDLCLAAATAEGP